MDSNKYQLLSILIPLAISLVVIYAQRWRDNANLAKTYQDIARAEADFRVRLEKRRNEKIDALKAELEQVTKDRDNWRELAEQQAEKIDNLELKIAELEKQVAGLLDR